MYIQCHPDGDRRFCALYAQLPTTGKSIHTHYYENLRDEKKHQCSDPFSPYIALNSEVIPTTRELLWYYYLMLWKCYFEDSPSLFDDACKYDGFYVNEGSEIYYAIAGRKIRYREEINDAACIAYLVGNTLQLPLSQEPTIVPIFPIIETAYRRYRTTFPRAH